jgi:DNA end-binding protein Ku
MPRSVWSGAIAFGLVNVPVGLHSATESRTVHFHQLQRRTNRRIRNKRVAEGTGREVDYDDIVKGYETDDGDMVVVTPEELEAVEPGRSRSIDIEDFVALDEIDPVYFDKAYYLVPGDGAEKPYALLREAMERSGRIAIGRFVMRTKQYLAAIRPSGDVLVLQTMYFGDEVRDPADLDLPGKVELSDKELRIARQLVDSLTVDFDPTTYVDTYRERVLDLVRQKAEGGDVEVAEAEEPRDVGDLMAALEASISDIRSARLDRLSVGELRDRAKEAEIPGRSKMSKTELVDALRAAS